MYAIHSPSGTRVGRYKTLRRALARMASSPRLAWCAVYRRTANRWERCAP